MRVKFLNDATIADQAFEAGKTYDVADLGAADLIRRNLVVPATERLNVTMEGTSAGPDRILSMHKTYSLPAEEAAELIRQRVAVPARAGATIAQPQLNHATQV